MKTADEKRRERLEWFRDRCQWLEQGAVVPLELARGVVAASAHWYQKTAGPVLIPGQAQHVTNGVYGWGIYDSNTFEISLFVRAASEVIRHAYVEAIEGRTLKHGRLRDSIASLAHWCVTDYKGDLYPNYSHGRHIMAFGSHAIHTELAADYLLEEASYKLALRPAPPVARPSAVKGAITPRTPASLLTTAQRLREEASRASAGRPSGTPKPLPMDPRKVAKLKAREESVQRQLQEIVRNRGRRLTPDQEAYLRKLLDSLVYLEDKTSLSATERQYRDKQKTNLERYIRRLP